MTKAVQFLVWKNNRNNFYFGVGGIGESKPFKSLASVIAAAEDLWVGFGKACGIYGTHTKATFLATHPVPYTRASLKLERIPKLVAIRPFYPRVKAIKRHAAVQKIIEGAKVGMKVDIPKTASGKLTRVPEAHPVAKAIVEKAVKRRAAIAA